jgi:hypothetical protein
MNVFLCDHCRNLVFFESVSCVRCGRTLAYLTPLGVVGSLDPAGDGTHRSPLPRAAGRAFRLCANYERENVCNWAVPAEDPNPFCRSCRLSRVIPDLSAAGARERWARLEAAKRRLVYTLATLGLPLDGLWFEFKADCPSGQAPVLTGHAGGVVTVNIAEACTVEIERRRVDLNEPYRTLIGHLRHESGHYYFDRLIAADAARLEAFRAVFGDEREDYGEALRRHYADGPAEGWQDRFISAYAASHPWEDWAETWAHYLHMVDALETGAACGLSLSPPREGAPAAEKLPDPLAGRTVRFADMLTGWHALTNLLNMLNRGMGLPDGYPFVLTGPAVEKLNFIHDVVTSG